MKEDDNQKKRGKKSEKNVGNKKPGQEEIKEQKNKEKKASIEETIKRRNETIEVLRNLSKSQHNDQYELRAMLDVKLGEISSLIEKFSKNMDVRMEEEFVSLRDVVHSKMDSLSEEVKNSPERMLEKTEEIHNALKEKIEDSVDIISNGLSHIGDVFEKLELSFKEEINALRETLQKVFEEMYVQFKGTSEGLKELTSSVEKYVEDFKAEREKYDKRRNKEEARRLNDMAVKNFYTGKVELAISQLKEAAILDDSSPEILANLAAALSKDGKQKDARKVFDKVLEKAPGMVEAQVGMGLIVFERGNIDEAIEIFKEASKKEETGAFTYANLGYAYEQKEMLDKAISNWQKAIELDPTLQDVEEKLKLYKDREA
jgi:tetratricopeptide (TPR) repeat protein